MFQSVTESYVLRCEIIWGSQSFFFYKNLTQFKKEWGKERGTGTRSFPKTRTWTGVAFIILFKKLERERRSKKRNDWTPMHIGMLISCIYIYINYSTFVSIKFRNISKLTPSFFYLMQGRQFSSSLGGAMSISYIYIFIYIYITFQNWTKFYFALYEYQ